MFFQTDGALVADDDVVDQLDVEDAASRHELFGGLDILLRRYARPAGRRKNRWRHVLWLRYVGLCDHVQLALLISSIMGTSWD